MLTIRDLRKTMGGRTLFEHAAMTVNYGERVALVGPNGAGKSTLFSIILKKDTPDAGTVERDEWTMVGYLPQESEAVGEETVMDVATGRAGEVPRWRSSCTSWKKPGRVSGPEYLEAHAKHEALNDPQVEAKAKKMLRGLGYRETDFERKAQGDERRLGHARASRAAAGHGAGSAAARRADQSPRPALAALAAGLPEELFRRAACSFRTTASSWTRSWKAFTKSRSRKLIGYTGNYSDFLRQREANYEQQLAAYKNQQKEIARAARILRSLPPGRLQGFAGHEQAQADRADGADRETDCRRRSRSVSNSAAAARRAARHFAGGNSHGLRQASRFIAASI